MLRSLIAAAAGLALVVGGSTAAMAAEGLDPTVDSVVLAAEGDEVADEVADAEDEVADEVADAEDEVADEGDDLADAGDGGDGDGTPQPTAVNTGDGLNSSNNSTALFAAAAGLFLLGSGAYVTRRRSVQS